MANHMTHEELNQLLENEDLELFVGKNATVHSILNAIYDCCHK